MTTDSAAAADDDKVVAAKAAASEAVTRMTVLSPWYLKLKVLAAAEHAVHYVSPLAANLSCRR